MHARTPASQPTRRDDGRATRTTDDDVDRARVVEAVVVARVGFASVARVVEAIVDRANEGVGDARARASERTVETNDDDGDESERERQSDGDGDGDESGDGGDSDGIVRARRRTTNDKSTDDGARDGGKRASAASVRGDHR